MSKVNTRVKVLHDLISMLDDHELRGHGAGKDKALKAAAQETPAEHAAEEVDEVSRLRKLKQKLEE